MPVSIEKATKCRSYRKLDTHDSICTKITLIRVIPSANVQPCAECKWIA